MKDSELFRGLSKLQLPYEAAKTLLDPTTDLYLQMLPDMIISLLYVVVVAYFIGLKERARCKRENINLESMYLLIQLTGISLSDLHKQAIKWSLGIFFIFVGVFLGTISL